MSKYQDWMNTQSLEFVAEVHPGFTIPTKFKLERPPITLKELEELDNKFIHNNPEGKNGNTSD